MISYQKNLKFAYLQVLQLQIVGFHCLLLLLNSSTELRCLYWFGILFDRRLPLKRTACVLYRRVFTSGSFNKHLPLRLYLFIFKSKNSALVVG